MSVGVSVTSNKCTRHNHACAPMFFCSCVPVLPDGVIGNTWAFGAHVPGSSPGRVVETKYEIRSTKYETNSNDKNTKFKTRYFEHLKF